ncbi:MAG: hypothetical protein L0Y36_05380 [Planctomycetales bacterium]|nr:hypothetical protein [Planctomycetales bacterium]
MAFLRQVFCAVLTVFLSVLPLVLLAWVLEEGEPGAFFGTFTYVLSGRIFNEGWNRIHAGTVLDQPTIGKWYFWFTVFTVVWLSYMALVRRFCVRRSKLRHGIFAIAITILCLFLVCLLTIPFWWLIQYIHAMGWTPKRFYGVLYAIAGYTAVLWFGYRAFRFKRRNENSES